MFVWQMMPAASAHWHFSVYKPGCSHAPCSSPEGCTLEGSVPLQEARIWGHLQLLLKRHFYGRSSLHADPSAPAVHIPRVQATSRDVQFSLLFWKRVVSLYYMHKMDRTPRELLRAPGVPRGAWWSSPPQGRTCVISLITTWVHCASYSGRGCSSCCSSTVSHSYSSSAWRRFQNSRNRVTRRDGQQRVSGSAGTPRCLVLWACSLSSGVTRGL